MTPIRHLAATVLLAALCVGPARAGLIGSTVHARLLDPDTQTVFEDYGTFTITGNENIVSSDNFTSFGFNDSQIIVTNRTAGQFDPTTPFDGYDFDFLSGITITGASIDAASDPAFAVGASLAGSAGNDIQLNFAGTCSLCVGGEQILIDVQSTPTAAAVPEPASIPLVALGLVGLVAARRRR